MAITEDMRVRRTRTALQKALTTLLAEKPFKKIRVNEIAELAQIARPTFYLHYETKDHLLVSLFGDLFSEFRLQVTNDIKNGSRDFNQFSHYLITFWENHDATLKTLMNAGIEPVLFEQFYLMLNDINNTFKEQEEGDYPPADAYVCDFMTGGLFMILRRWVNDDQPPSADELASFLGALLSGIHRSVTERC